MHCRRRKKAREAGNAKAGRAAAAAAAVPTADRAGPELAVVAQLAFAPHGNRMEPGQAAGLPVATQLALAVFSGKLGAAQAAELLGAALLEFTILGKHDGGSTGCKAAGGRPAGVCCSWQQGGRLMMW